MQGLKSSESTETVPSDNDSNTKSQEGRRTPKSKKIKSIKKDRLNPARFQGQGVSFKAKLIGVEELNEARGDKLCQETITRLKAAVKSTGTHKQRIWFSISLEGIKIREDKSGLEPLYHHSVPQISFISQDVTDDRAFGYICSPIPDTYHFVAIKTEKTASQVVLTLRDLFQTVLDMKQRQSQEIQDLQPEDTPDGCMEESPQSAVENPVEITETKSEVLPTAECPRNEDDESVTETSHKSLPNGQAIADLLDLRFEPNFQHLQESIAQMTHSLTSSPFQNSPLLVPQNEAETPQPKEEESAVVEEEVKPSQPVIDKYAVFENLDAQPSIFEQPLFVTTATADFIPQQLSPPPPQLPENIFTEDAENEVSPLQPSRESSYKPLDFSVLADLDPLGKNRPYVDKKDFFNNIKNPPRKVLKDLAGGSFDSSTNGVSIRRLESQNSFDLPPRIPPRANPFSCSSLPPSTPPPVLTMTSRCSDPVFPILPSPPLHRPRQTISLTGPQSPPIPIPPRRISPLANEDSPLSMRRGPRVSSESDKSSPGTWGVFDDNFNDTPSPLAISKPSFIFPNKQIANERPKNPFSNTDDVTSKVNPCNPFMLPPDRLTPPPTPPIICDTSTSIIPSEVFANSDVFSVNPEKQVAPPTTQPISPEEGNIFRRKQDPFADDFFEAFNKN